MVTEYEILEMHPDRELLDSRELTLATEYEILKMHPDRVLPKCAVFLVILAGLALMG